MNDQGEVGAENDLAVPRRQQAAQPRAAAVNNTPTQLPPGPHVKVASGDVPMKLVRLSAATTDSDYRDVVVAHQRERPT